MMGQLGSRVAPVAAQDVVVGRDGITRGAFGTTVATHSTGTPAVIVSREDLTPLTSPLLAGHQGGTLWIKTQPTDGQSVVDLSLVTPEPLLVPVNLLATITVTAPAGGTAYIGLPLTITWLASQLTGTVDLSYSTDGGTTWTSIATGAADSGTYAWSTTGLSAAATVLVRVASTTTPTVYGTSYTFALAAPTAPGAPTGLTEAPADSAAILTWTAPVGGVAPQLYRIKQATTSGGPYTTVATIYAPPGETLATSAAIGGLTNTAYYFVVTAVANGAESSASNEANAVPLAPTPTLAPPAPTAVSATAGNGQVVIEWSATSLATTYDVRRSLVTGGAYTTVASGLTVLTYTDTGLDNAVEYFYVVDAENSVGTSLDSAEVSAIPTAGISGSFASWAWINQGPAAGSVDSGKLTIYCRGSGDIANELRGLVFDASAGTYVLDLTCRGYAESYIVTGAVADNTAVPAGRVAGPSWTGLDVAQFADPTTFVNQTSYGANQDDVLVQVVVASGSTTYAFSKDAGSTWISAGSDSFAIARLGVGLNSVNPGSMVLSAVTLNSLTYTP